MKRIEKFKFLKDVFLFCKFERKIEIKTMIKILQMNKKIF